MTTNEPNADVRTHGHGTTLTIHTLDDSSPAVETLVDLKIHPRDFQLPSLKMGGPNNLTTFDNVRWETKAPKQIIKVGQIKFKCTYKEESLDLIIANLGKNSKLTITFDSGSTWVVWGWLEEFNPDTDTEDTPMAEAVLELSMRQDNADPVVTVAPVYTAFDPDA